MNLEKYINIIFDCDGVLLNSNKIKTDAFYEFANFSGERNAQILKEFHIKNGGISRYEKITYLYENILKKKISKDFLFREAKRYGNLVFNKLLDAEISSGLDDLRKINKTATWSVVSGGDEKDLKRLFKKNGLSKFFGEKVYGSPRSKEEIFAEEYDYKSLKNSSLFIGDSKYDMIVAQRFEIDFVFLSKWSEWDLTEVPRNIKIASCIKELSKSNKL